MAKITIIATGEELLNGSTVNTNSAYICRALADLDFEIASHVTVGDRTEAILSAATGALGKSDLVIVTGGLGPTDDDNTVEALCRLAGKQAVLDQDACDTMAALFMKMGRSVSDMDKKMAEVVKDSIVVKNTRGLAPGFIIELDGKIVMAMPGVPAEMEIMFDERVKPYLIKRFNARQKRTVRIKLVGMKESDVNARINSSAVLSGSGNWGITVASGITTVSFFETPGRQFDPEKLIAESQRLFKNDMLFPGSTVPEEDILAVCLRQSMTIATAESCTGGLISKRFTDIPGASEAFMGGVTAYSNESKTALLGVPEKLISKHGAVSVEVAGAMAMGARKTFGADAVISTTGVAGPGGGSPEKPAGTVCFGFVLGDECSTEKKFFPGDRQQVRERASIYAADRMRRLILAREKDHDKK